MQAQVCVDNIRESKTFDTMGRARAWAAERERLLAHAPKGSDKPLREALDRYARDVSPSHKGERWELVRLNALGRDTLAAVPLNVLAAPDLAAWRDRRLQRVSAGSVRREMALLGSVLNVARLDWGWLVVNPMADVRKPPAPRHRDRRIDDDEIKAITKALGYFEGVPETQKQFVAIVFLLAIETAMRSGELLSLTWKQTHLKKSYVELRETKNGDARKVPLSSEAVRLIELLPCNGEQLFPMTDAVRDTLFREARDLANLDDLHFHDARHEAITRLAGKLDVLELARMTGHRNINELRTYYNKSATEIAKRLG